MAISEHDINASQAAIFIHGATHRWHRVAINEKADPKLINRILNERIKRVVIRLIGFLDPLNGVGKMKFAPVYFFTVGNDTRQGSQSGIDPNA